MIYGYKLNKQDIKNIRECPLLKRGHNDFI